MAEPDAVDLASAAKDLISVEDPGTAGLWPRAAAFLGRRSIEMSMDRLWARRAPELASASLRCQLLCLATVLRDAGLAGRAVSAWGSLSRACHHHVYEMPPTAPELDGWLQVAWSLAHAVRDLR